MTLLKLYKRKEILRNDSKDTLLLLSYHKYNKILNQEIKSLQKRAMLSVFIPQTSLFFLYIVFYQLHQRKINEELIKLTSFDIYFFGFGVFAVVFLAFAGLHL